MATDTDDITIVEPALIIYIIYFFICLNGMYEESSLILNRTNLITKGINPVNIIGMHKNSGFNS